MKLFIWEGSGVLSDYSNGMVIAMAPNLEAAVAEIEKSHGIDQGKYFGIGPTSTVELGPVEKTAESWVCWGAG